MSNFTSGSSIDTASGLTPLCLADDVPEGQALRVVLGQQRIAVFRLQGRFHATDDTCTHGFASLSRGQIEGNHVICPWHGGAFDIATGQAVGAPCTVALKTYPCTLRDGSVQARL